MAAPRLAAASCHALRGVLHDKLRAVELQLRACRRSLAGASGSSSTTAAAVAALVFAAAAFPRAAAFFLPLVASTSLCCTAACLFAAVERSAAKEAVEAVVVDGEGKAEAGLLQVIGEANTSAYGDRLGSVQVGCFIRRSARRGVDEDGEEVVFAGTLAPCAAGFVGAGHAQRRGAALEEELTAMRVDRLAEGVWNSYFGGWSWWHHIDTACSL
jgi:hypothetical protein